MASVGGCNGLGLGLLPVDVLLLVMSDYLGGAFRDVSAMDIAFAPSARADFLTAVSQHALNICGDVENPITKLLGFLEWARDRQVHPSQLNFKWSDLEAFSSIPATVLANVQRIVLYNDAELPAREVFGDLLRKCPRLESVTLKRVQGKSTWEDPHHPCNLIVGQLIDNPHLPLKFFSQMDTDFDVGSVARLLGTFRDTLEELELNKALTLFQELPLCTALRKLTIGTWVHSIQELQDMVAAMPLLRELTISAFITVIDGLTSLSDILGACPTIHKLRLPGMWYDNLKSRGRAGCVLHHPAQGKFSTIMFEFRVRSALLSSIIQACPVPVLELSADGDGYGFPVNLWRSAAQFAGNTLEAIFGNIIRLDMHWSDEDIVFFLGHCTALTSLKLVDGHRSARVQFLQNNHIHLLAEHCGQLLEFTLVDAGAIADDSVQAVLRSCGPNLIKLTLINCKKLSNLTLQTIVEHCTQLRELTLLKTAITTANLLETLVLPDNLKMLRKLVVGPRMGDMLIANEAAGARWKAVIDNAEV